MKEKETKQSTATTNVTAKITTTNNPKKLKQNKKLNKRRKRKKQTNRETKGKEKKDQKKKGKHNIKIINSAFYNIAEIAKRNNGTLSKLLCFQTSLEIRFHEGATLFTAEIK